jgi:hypothetical protein
LALANKLALEWKGPSRVVNVKSEWTYEVASLLPPHSVSTHHVSRLKFYADAARGVVDDLTAYAIAHQDTLLVEELLECRKFNGQWQVLVKWLGFDALEATWQPFDALQADIPAIVKKTLETPRHESFQLLNAHLAAFPAS